MSLRVRIATTAATAVVLAVLVVGGLVYAATARQVRRDLDDDLGRAAAALQASVSGDVLAAMASDPPSGPRERGREAARGRLLDRLPGRGALGDGVERLLGPLGGGVVQLVDDELGTRTFGDAVLPVDDTTAELAAGEGDGAAAFSEAEVEGRRVRIVAVPLADGGAVQVGALADSAGPALTALRRQLSLAAVLGAGLAGLLGLVVAGGALRPVRRLTDTAEAVGRTGDLSTRIDVLADDELGRLAAAFNGMLAGLESARAAQRQLVADASHELRTPLTSLRTNIEVLQLEEQLAPDERAALLRDVTLQLEEFGRLVDGLVELARGDRPARAPTPVALADLAADVVDRAVVFHPGVDVTVEADASVVVAERDRLERAVANLVDNALKHGQGTSVTVTVADGSVSVRDRGPGIDTADLERVFDRFYRSPGARSLPGSGLGLSIVAQVAESHGGSVRAGNHPDGGAVVSVTLPTA